MQPKKAIIVLLILLFIAVSVIVYLFYINKQISSKGRLLGEPAGERILTPAEKKAEMLRILNQGNEVPSVDPEVMLNILNKDQDPAEADNNIMREETEEEKIRRGEILNTVK